MTPRRLRFTSGASRVLTRASIVAAPSLTAKLAAASLLARAQPVARDG